MSENSPKKIYLTPKQISEYLNLPLRSVYNLLESGKLKSFSFTDRTYRVELKDLEVFTMAKANF